MRCSRRSGDHLHLQPLSSATGTARPIRSSCSSSPALEEEAKENAAKKKRLKALFADEVKEEARSTER